MMPVAIALMGLTDAMVLAVIAFGALWPMLLATVHGFAAVEPRLYQVSRALGLSRGAVIWKIALPSAMPDILSGMRVGLTRASSTSKGAGPRLLKQVRVSRGHPNLIAIVDRDV